MGVKMSRVTETYEIISKDLVFMLYKTQSRRETGVEKDLNK